MTSVDTAWVSPRSDGPNTVLVIRCRVRPPLRGTRHLDRYERLTIASASRFGLSLSRPGDRTQPSNVSLRQHHSKRTPHQHPRRRAILSRAHLNCPRCSYRQRADARPPHVPHRHRRHPPLHRQNRTRSITARLQGSSSLRRTIVHGINDGRGTQHRRTSHRWALQADISSPTVKPRSLGAWPQMIDAARRQTTCRTIR